VDAPQIQISIASVQTSRSSVAPAEVLTLPYPNFISPGNFVKSARQKRLSSFLTVFRLHRATMLRALLN